jgi:hypothetical protein
VHQLATERPGPRSLVAVRSRGSYSFATNEAERKPLFLPVAATLVSCKQKYDVV